MSQLHAAYLFDSVKELFDEKQFNELLSPQIRQLACFDFHSKTSFKTKEIHPQTAVVHNMITAGRPMRPSVYLEELFSVYLKRTEKSLQPSELAYPFNDNDLKKEIEAAFFITDPRSLPEIPKEKDKKQQFNAHVVETFITGTHNAFKQFFRKNTKAISSIIPDDDNSLSKEELDLAKTKPDFFIQLPLSGRGIKGVMIETDHETGMAGMDFLGIEKKKALAARYGYNYIFVKNGQIKQALAEFESFTFNDYFDRIKKNHDIPLFGRTTGKDALQYVLGPIAVARIQKIITELIFAGQLNPDAKQWKVAVIERDVPAAYAAFEDLRRRYNRVCEFQGIGKQFPDIELEIFTSPEFADAKMHKACKNQTFLPDEFDSKKEYDLLIDISILQTSHYEMPSPRNAATNVVKITSCQMPETNHTFYFGKTLNFFETDQIMGKKRKEAFLAISRDIFRINSLPDEDIRQMIKGIFGGEFFILQSPLKRNPIFEILFALFRPGVLVSVCPNNISLLNRFQAVRKVGIQAAYYQNGIQHRLKDKKAVAERIVNREALIVFTTPDYLRNPFFESTAEQIVADGLNFSGVFIHGATGLSEFSTDFNPFYKGMVKRLRNLLKVKGFSLPIFAFAHHSDYAVTEDIKADMGLTEVYYDRPLVPIFDVKRIATRTTGVNDSEIILRKAKEAKQEALYELINNMSKKEKLLIIYPFREGKAGHYSQNLEDSFADLRKHFPDEEFALFTETDIRERSKFSADDYITSMDAYEEFFDGRSRIMLATEQIIYAFPPQELKHIVLYNMPGSPEALYQTASLFWADTPENKLYILQDESDFISREFSDAATADGKQESMEQVARITTDIFVRSRKAKLYFAGRRADFSVADEMLNMVSIPEREAKTELENAIRSEFELDTELYAMPEDKPVRIYAGKDNKTVGYYDFSIDMPNTDHTAFSENYALQILYFIKESARKHPEGVDQFLLYFAKKIPGKTIPGIETRFNDMKTGESENFSFYLSNNAFAEIKSSTLKYASYSFGNEDLRLLLEISVSEKDFIKRINKLADFNYVSAEIDLPAKLKDLFTSYRDVCNTLLIISRFCDMGLIDDYSADTNSGHINIGITKRPDSFYKEKLKVILSKYLSHEKAEEVFNALDDYSGDTVIRKVLNFLINFIYDELREQHYAQIENMAEWLNRLSEIEEEEIRRIELKNYFHSVFSAKYLNSLGSPSLINETDNFEGGSFDTVMAFIYKAEYLKSNIEHLYLSSDKAQKVHPDNYIVLLLNAFARFRKFGNKEGFDKAFSRLYLGFEEMEKTENLDYEESIRRRKLFLELLYKYNKTLQEETDPLIYLKTHSQKLVDFNARFLKGFKAAVK